MDEFDLLTPPWDLRRRAWEWFKLGGGTGKQDGRFTDSRLSPYLVQFVSQHPTLLLKIKNLNNNNKNRFVK